MKQSTILFFVVAGLMTLGQGCPESKKSEKTTADTTPMVSSQEGEATRLQLDFREADFDAAVASNKLVVLYFYANWCPICRAEFPRMQEAFGQLAREDVVGFRVNFNDNETSPEEEALARTHGVAYQHTKVFIKNGERVLKAPDSWNTERYLEEIGKY